MTEPLRLRAPATTANLGPGFDCAAVALDLWNELEITEGEGVEIEGEGADELYRAESHLGIEAFALLSSPRGLRFRFVNRIPLARGLGSSAATIALGVAAAQLVEGRPVDPEALLDRALRLEGHGDNLAAALAGGVCLTWTSGTQARIARVAESLPVTPIAIIPETQVTTVFARGTLPDAVTHADASYTVGRATLLGAALASGDLELLGEAFDDRLHEPYRAPNSPLLWELRERVPAGAIGVTISGSGPTVIVWAADAEACTAELAERYPRERVLPLAVSPTGVGSLQ